MGISDLVIRVAFLALPGLLASKLYRKLRGRTQKKAWEDFLEVLLFSVASYVLLAALVGVWESCSCTWGPSTRPSTTNSPWTVVTESISDTQKPIAWPYVAWASLIGVLLATIASLMHTYKIVSRCSNRMCISRRTGDEDLWDYFLTSSDTDDWLFVRDHQEGLVYFGAITQFSESERERELIIQQVTVYNDDGVELYQTQAVYLSRKHSDLTIQLRDPKAS